MKQGTEIKLPITSRRIKKEDGTHAYPQINLPSEITKDYGFRPGDKVQIRYQLNAVYITNTRPVTQSAYFRSGANVLLSRLEIPVNEDFVEPEMPRKTPIKSQIVEVGKTGCDAWCPLPALRLCNAWLAEAGFFPDKKAKVYWAMNTIKITNIKSVAPFPYIDQIAPDIDPSRKTLKITQLPMERKNGWRLLPYIRFGGRWLEKFAFQPDKKVFIRYEHQRITITTQPLPDLPCIMKGYVKRVTLQKLRTGYPGVRLRGKWIARLGFAPGEKIAISCSPSMITITRAKPGKRSGYIEMPFDKGGVDHSIYRARQPRRYLRLRKVRKTHAYGSKFLRLFLWHHGECRRNGVHSQDKITSHVPSKN
jgi:Toxin SymE, type I toxin-antitoxin system